MKKKTIVPLIVFLLGICLVGLIVYKIDSHETEQQHIKAQLNATTYGERIKNEITNGIAITDTLKQVLISENGKISQFDTIAENIMSDVIESIQLAPDGNVTDIYPSEGTEASKIDLLQDKDCSKISCYARDNHVIITQGPFDLKRGGCGIAVRNPVYLKDENNQEYFWGFTIVILRVPDIFSDAISALSDFGYEYRLSKTDAPWSDTYKVVYQSDDQLTHTVSYGFTIGEENWTLEVAPESGWRDLRLLVIVGGMFTTVVLLFSGLTRVWLVLWGGYESIKDTLNPLLGESPDPELIAKITETVLNHKMVIGVHDIVVHDYGPGRRIVSLHAEVPYNKDMMEVHDLMDHIEMRLMEEYHCEATIHMDPVVTDDAEVNETRKEVLEIVEKYDKTLSVHDFRMVKGPTHTNVIFDLVVPYGKEYDPERIVKDIKEEIKNEMVGKYYAVIRIDRF